MKQEQHILNEVNKTLESLDGIQRAPSNPYLFTRIMARMQNAQPSGFWITASNFLSRPVVAVAALVLILAMNFAVFFDDQPEAVQPAEDEQLLASEYNLPENGFYDLTIEQ